MVPELAHPPIQKGGTHVGQRGEVADRRQRQLDQQVEQPDGATGDLSGNS